MKCESNEPKPPLAPSPLRATRHDGWTGDPGDIAQALAVPKSNEVEEVEDPPVSLSQDDDDSRDLSGPRHA